MEEQEIMLSEVEQAQRRFLTKEERKRKRRFRNKVLKVVTILIVIMLIGAYLLSDLSKVKSLIVRNNHFYEDEYVLNLANLDYNSSFVLNPSFLIERRIEKDRLIKNAEVKKNLHGGFDIEIEEEKIIGYLSSVPEKLLIQGSGIEEVKRESMHLFSQLPRIGQFNEGQLAMLDEAFAEVDLGVIQMISEIEPYQTSYDENMVQLVMIDGNRISASMKGIVLVNNYKSILKELEGTHVCLYADDISGNIFKEAIDCREGLVNRVSSSDEESQTEENQESVAENGEEPESIVDENANSELSEEQASE